MIIVFLIQLAMTDQYKVATVFILTVQTFKNRVTLSPIDGYANCDHNYINASYIGVSYLFC